MTFDWTKITGIILIALGAGIMYYPPVALGASSGTVAFATTLIAAGAAALGVPIAGYVAQARARGVAEVQRSLNRSAGARRAAQTRAARRGRPTEFETEVDRP